MMKKKHNVVYVFVCAFMYFGAQTLTADLISITGNINFDSNNNSSVEMTLNSDGLGVSTQSPSANLHVSGNAIVTSNLSVGSSTSSNATLNVSGSMGYSIELVSDNVTLSGNSYIIAGSGVGDLTITLPSPANAIGRLYSIKKNKSTHNVIIQGGGNLDNLASVKLTSGNLGFIEVIASDTQTWSILSLSGNGN
jgi:hypothetical protein